MKKQSFKYPMPIYCKRCGGDLGEVSLVESDYDPVTEGFHTDNNACFDMLQRRILELERVVRELCTEHDEIWLHDVR